MLLVRHNIVANTDNCIQDDTNILNALPCVDAVDHYSAKLCSEISVIRKYDLLYEKPSYSDHDYCDVPNRITFSSYKEAAVAYMAGYVVWYPESSPTTIHRLESSPTGKFAAWKIHRSAIRRKENSPILQLIADDLFIKNHETWKTFTH